MEAADGQVINHSNEKAGDGPEQTSQYDDRDALHQNVANSYPVGGRPGYE